MSLPSVVGKWILIRSERPMGDQVSITFTAGGKATYSITDGGKKQLILLNYYVAGDELVTNQPSHPKEERTKFALEKENQVLVLEFDGIKSWFQRA